MLISLCICLSLAAAAPGRCGAESREDGPVRITADAMSHSREKDTIVATGTVTMIWQGATLTCDRATYSRPDQTVTAEGNITIVKGEDRVTGDTLTLDLGTGRGELSHGHIFLKQNNMRMGGGRIVRTGDDDYAVSDGNYTTCDAEVPSWKFGAGELEMTLDQYATARDIVFYIKDIPIFYFPYAIFPVKRERQSGFLFPRFGWSGKKGAEADIYYYWAISPSQEATIDLDIQSRRGAGTGLDYRYLRSRTSQGTLGGYLIYDTGQDRLRGSITQNHRETIAPGTSLRSSINMTTDRGFLSDYGEKSGDYNRQYGDSTVNFLNTWQNYALGANLRYTQDYYAANNRTTLQALPEITLAAVRERLLATPLYFDLDSSTTNFYRTTGVRGQRAYLFPRVSLVSGLPGYLHFSVYGGAHIRGYLSGNTPSASAVRGNDGIIIPEGGARIATSVARVFDIGGERVTRLRHEIVPEVSYRYTPPRDQSRFPEYDPLDRIPHQNLVGWSITSLLGGKIRTGGTEEYRELSRIRVSQGYSITGTRNDLLTTVDTGRPWSDLVLESETRLHPALKITLDGRYSVTGGAITSAAPGLEFDNHAGTTAAFSYRLARNSVEYLEGRFSTRLTAPIILGYLTRYSFDSRTFLESVYSAEFRHQCWSVVFSYFDRNGPNAGHGFNVSFNLLGAFGSGSAAGVPLNR